jgi:hypothetical protein
MMHSLDTDEPNELIRYSKDEQGSLAGKERRVDASWQAHRWSLTLKNVSRQDGGYYECQVGLPR